VYFYLIKKKIASFEILQYYHLPKELNTVPKFIFLLSFYHLKHIINMLLVVLTCQKNIFGIYGYLNQIT